MISEDKIVTAPFGWPELASLLGTGADEGQICKSENINMWSRHKPVAFKKLSPLFELGENDSQVCEWKGNDRINMPFGLSMPKDVSDIRLLKGLKITYANRPTGTMESPYRLHDFEGYNHKSVCPWKIRFPEGEMYKNQTNVLIHFYEASNLPEGNLSVSDIMDENRKYIAVGIWDESKSAPAEMKTFPNDSPSISLEGCSFVTDVTSEVELTMLAAFTNHPIADWSDVAEQTFYAIDCDDMPAMSHITVKPINYESTWFIKTKFKNKDGSSSAFLIMRTGEQKATDGRIYAIAEWRRKPAAYYTIKSIDVVAYKIDDHKVQLGTGTITDVSSCIPATIGTSDYVDTNGTGEIQFRVDINNSIVKAPDGTTVTGGAYYEYTLNYEQE